jgi:hypothetical protein
MLIRESQLVPPQILSGLISGCHVPLPYETPLELSIDKNPAGTHYLNLLISKDEEYAYRLLVEISKERLSLVASGEMCLALPFLYPENRIFYAAIFDSDGILTKLGWELPAAFEQSPPFPVDLSFAFCYDTSKPIFNLVEHAQRRGRVLIDLRIEAKSLRSNVRYWSIKNFLIPFAELIKTALIDQHPDFSAKTFEKYADFGLDCLETGFLHAILEFNYRIKLFDNYREYDNIVNLYALLQEDNEGKMIEDLGCFTNKKLIPDYIKVLRALITNNASLFTTVATPRGIVSQALFDCHRSINIKKILESRLLETSYEQTVVGILTKLDFNRKGEPGFALHSTLDDQSFCGTIDTSIRDRICGSDFNFLNKEYQCLLNVIYTPESLVNKEKYDYFLLDISQ